HLARAGCVPGAELSLRAGDPGPAHRRCGLARDAALDQSPAHGRPACRRALGTALGAARGPVWDTLGPCGAHHAGAAGSAILVARPGTGGAAEWCPARLWRSVQDHGTDLRL